MADWLLSEYGGRKGGGFNYDPAINTICDAFRGKHSLESAVRHCQTHGNPKGRKQNVEAIRTLMPYILENTSLCYRIGLTAIAIGRYDGKTVYAKIKAPLLRVRGGKAFIVMPGLRLSYIPSEIAIDFACSVALSIFAQDDHEGADFEYLYAGPALGSARDFRAIHGRDRFRFTGDAIDRLLDIYVKGVALAEARGADTKSPILNGYRIIDPQAPRFF
ncbi:hypothetical protein [Sphingobium ummariense]|uniref:hypothetical protein n=1 Tax=Sphingobium ummariense TaxID=420994 RepID=UPI001F3C64F9|nr:hypothetical protein [Sphingobium ummariense]